MQSRLIKEVLRVIAVCEEEDQCLKKKCEFKIDFIDCEARNIFE